MIRQEDEIELDRIASQRGEAFRWKLVFESWAIPAMKQRVALLLTMLSWAAMEGASYHWNAKSLPSSTSSSIRSTENQPSLLAQTKQKRNDRVVGFWMSTTGVAVTLAYSGNASSFWIQVFPNTGRSNPRVDYTARWTSENQFFYVDLSGSKISGRVEPSEQIIHLSSDKGWHATWTRKR